MTNTIKPTPTPRQLRYLRALAQRSGSTFSLPLTRAEASGEIERLRLLGAGPRAGFEHDDDAGRYATAVHADEVSGYGSSATWRSKSPCPRPPADARAEGRLLSYRVGGCSRMLEGERAAELIRVTDRPENGNGVTYLVEEGVEPSGLHALCRDYVEQAQLLDEVPMARTAIHELLPGAHDV